MAAGKAFVTLLDSVFTEIAFTYVSRTKIKQIRKCCPALPATVPVRSTLSASAPLRGLARDFTRTLLTDFALVPISPDPKISKYFQVFISIVTASLFIIFIYKYTNIFIAHIVTHKIGDTILLYIRLGGIISLPREITVNNNIKARTYIIM